jgi:hypothetical protein
MTVLQKYLKGPRPDAARCVSLWPLRALSPLRLKALLADVGAKPRWQTEYLSSVSDNFSQKEVFVKIRMLLDKNLTVLLAHDLSGFAVFILLGFGR